MSNALNRSRGRREKGEKEEDAEGGYTLKYNREREEMRDKSVSKWA